MSIKDLKPHNSSFSKNLMQGYFTPKNKEKYAGKLPIIYRSSLEYKFCITCDEEPKILKWSSESLAIPYHNPIEGKTRNYYPDYCIQLLKNGRISDLIIEVKAGIMLQKPEKPKLKATKQSIRNYNFRLKSYIINMVKRQAAEAYCSERGMKYMFLTESFFS